MYNINAETSRLHIVVGLELTDPSNSEITTEHQNRFILFNASEDALSRASFNFSLNISISASNIKAGEKEDYGITSKELATLVKNNIVEETMEVHNPVVEPINLDELDKTSGKSSNDSGIYSLNRNSRHH